MRAILAEDGRIGYIGDDDTLEPGMKEVELSYRNFVLLAREYEGLQRRAQCVAETLKAIHKRCQEFLSNCSCGGRPEALSCYGSLICNQCGRHFPANVGDEFKVSETPVVQWQRSLLRGRESDID